MIIFSLRRAWRSITRNPIASLTVIAVLALGIGANLAVFSLVDFLLFRPLPVYDPGNLVAMYGHDWNDTALFQSSYAAYLDYKHQAKSFDELAAYVHRVPMHVSTAAQGSVRIQGDVVSGNYFKLLGVHPLEGRFIDDDDDIQNARHDVVVLGERLSKTLGLGNAAVGSYIKINGQPFTVVGIASPDFFGTHVDSTTEIWVPIASVSAVDPIIGHELMDRYFSRFEIIGRLAPNIGKKQAQAEVDVIRQNMTFNTDPWPAVVDMRGIRSASSVHVATIAIAITVIVLLIACVDVACILASRLQARNAELALSVALGASKPRILLPVICEAGLLSCLGAIAGLAAATFAVNLLRAIQPQILSNLGLQVSTSMGRDVVLAAIVAVMAAIVSGILPAVQVIDSKVNPILRSGEITASRASSRFVGQRILVVAQVTLGTVLLAGAGLLIRTLNNLSAIDLGVSADRVLVGSIDLNRQHYTRDRSMLFVNRLLDITREMPEVKRSAVGSSTPLQGTMQTVVVLPDGKTRATIDLNIVSREYFEVLDIPYVAGRPFGQGDRKNSPWVGIVNEAFVAQFFPSTNPLGQSVLRVGPESASVQIIAVVKNSKGSNIKEQQPATLYVPVHQFYDIFPWGLPNLNVLLQANSHNPAGLTQALRKSIESLDPDLPVFNVQVLTDYASKSIQNERLLTDLLVVLAFLSIILAMSGSYALTSQIVNSREREIGIRLSLGASIKNVVLVVARQHFLALAVGITCGVVLFSWLGRLLRSFLYGLHWNDASVLLVAITVMLSAGILPVLIPIRKIRATDCATLLRQR